MMDQILVTFSFDFPFAPGHFKPGSTLREFVCFSKSKARGLARGDRLLKRVHETLPRGLSGGHDKGFGSALSPAGCIARVTFRLYEKSKQTRFALVRCVLRISFRNARVE